MPPLSSKLDRKLRAVEESSDDEEYYEVSDRSSPSIVDTGAGEEPDVLNSGDDEGDGGASEDEMSGEADDNVQAQMSKVSFGALAKAQESISKQQDASRKRKRGDDNSALQEDKLEALRERLREIKAARLASGSKPSNKSKLAEKKKSVFEDDQDEVEEDEESDGDGDEDGPPHARTSKHAPAVQSSKRAVSRKRQVVDVKKPKLRDPRFDNIGGPRLDEHTLKKRYGFLDDYKKSEIEDLKNSIKKTKNETEKEKLKKKLLSMESQMKAQENKEKQQQILHEHKKKERELIKQGKQPFFLKKSEQKKLALIDKFQNMKGKQREKLIERRRKKATAKERRNMPDERRGA